MLEPARIFTAIAVAGLAVWLPLVGNRVAESVGASGLPRVDGGLPSMMTAWAGMWAAVVFGTLAVTSSHPGSFAFKRLRRINLAGLAVMFIGLLATADIGTSLRIVFLLHGTGAVLLWWWHGRGPRIREATIQPPTPSNPTADGHA